MFPEDFQDHTDFTWQQIFGRMMYCNTDYDLQ